MISTSGSGQMLPLPMNEFLQQNLKEACDVDVSFDVVEWQVLLTPARAVAGQRRACNGAMALNVSSPSSDAGVMARYFAAANFSPNGFNFAQWKDDKFDAALHDAGRNATDPRGDLDGLRRRRTSGWSTIRPGSTSSTTSIRAP